MFSKLLLLCVIIYYYYCFLIKLSMHIAHTRHQDDVVSLARRPFHSDLFIRIYLQFQLLHIFSHSHAISPIAFISKSIHIKYSRAFARVACVQNPLLIPSNNRITSKNSGNERVLACCFAYSWPNPSVSSIA